MEKLLSIAIGGAAGALARYGTVVVYQRYAPTTFPLAILTVNVLGCTAIRCGLGARRGQGLGV